MDIHFMSYDFADTQILVAAFAIVFVIIIAVAAFLDRRSARLPALRNRSGSEHVRAADEYSYALEAEAETGERESAA